MSAAFFRSYYAPDNAILCVAGDFEPARVRAGSRDTSAPCPAATGPPDRSRASRYLGRPEAHPADRRGQPAARPARLADRARRPSRRAGARYPGRRPGRPRQGEPPVPRPDVRPTRSPPAWPPSIRRTSSPANSRSSCTPIPIRTSPNWSSSPTPRSSGSSGTAHRVGGPQGPEPAGERADHGAPVGDSQGRGAQHLPGPLRRPAGAIAPSSTGSSR